MIIMSEMKPRGIYITDISLLLFFTVLTILSLFIPILSSSFIKPILGIIFIAFLPGYAFISYLFPKNDDMRLLERLLLSFATSVAIVALVGFVLNYTPFGIHLEIMALIISMIIILFTILAYFKRLSTDGSFYLEFKPTIVKIKNLFYREDRIDKVLSVVLLILIVLSISMTAYAIVKPKQSENFTEFYILGANGKMSNYPTTIKINETGNLTVGIVNHENVPTSYLIVFNINGTNVSENNITLQNGEQRNIPYNFKSNNTGKKEVEFLLYKQPNLQNVYLSLHFWVNAV